MSGGIEVDPEELRVHAAHLDGLIQRFETVKAAAAQISASPDAFGPLCEWMAGILEEKHQMVEPLFDQGMTSLGSNADALRACADVYEDADAVTAGDLDKLGGEL